VKTKKDIVPFSFLQLVTFVVAVDLTSLAAMDYGPHPTYARPNQHVNQVSVTV